LNPNIGRQGALLFATYLSETFMARHAIIIGANGQIGRATGERLLHAGWAVTCAQRGDPLPNLTELGARSIRLDRNEPGALRAALADGADAVIDTIAYDENHAAQLLEIQDAVGQFSVISTAGVYAQFPVPVPETQPTTLAGQQDYSTKKVALENTLLEHARVPVSLIRPCAIYGPSSKLPREWWFIKRYLDGRKRVPLKFEASIFHNSATPNIAAVIEAALEASFRGPLNAADPTTPNVREIAGIIARGLNWDCEFVTVPSKEVIDGVGVTPWSNAEPIMVDMRRAAQIGYRPVTDYASYAPEVCGWLIDAARGRDWRAVFPIFARVYADVFDYAAEDSFLKVTN
jgi:nucleoside-diphosphate-sugar epimerase